MRSTYANKSFGTYDHKAWFDEGQGLYFSARALRGQWVQLRRNFKKEYRKNPHIQPTGIFFVRLKGMPRASMLLLAYSAEMYLKSGLLKSFAKCSHRLIDRDTKYLGHKLARLAKEINFSLSLENLEHLKILTNLLLDARYPINPSKEYEWKDQKEYTKKVNARTETTWNKNLFAELCRLVREIRNHVQRIDGDSENPSTILHADLENNGYITLRHGGNLVPMVTFSDEDDRITPRTVGEIRELALDLGWIEAKHYWSIFSIRRDGKEKTLILHSA